MSETEGAEKPARRPAEEIPVLTEVVDAAQAMGLSSAQIDALVAQIERAVLEDLTPRLEDAVHHAVRAAVDQALAALQPQDDTP